MRICCECGAREDEAPGPWIRAELDDAGDDLWLCCGALVNRLRVALTPDEDSLGGAAA